MRHKFKEFKVKKIVMIVVLAVILATGTAFADHPSGWGVGVVGQYGIGWGGGGAGLSLKIPSVPVFWALNVGFTSDWFSAGLTGDYYMIDSPLVSDINLHWFFGLGGFFDFYNHTVSYLNKEHSYTSFSLGARVPVGLSWQPIDLLELFIDAAPSLGVGIRTESKVDDHVLQEGGAGFVWGIPIEIGLRLWF
ncbi:MAG TPA: hypothetical protein DEQ14_04125 [Treponema sp.]|nr:hypothetical protein [Treponema sp.]